MQLSGGTVGAQGGCHGLYVAQPWELQPSGLWTRVSRITDASVMAPTGLGLGFELGLGLGLGVRVRVRARGRDQVRVRVRVRVKVSGVLVLETW